MTGLYRMQVATHMLAFRNLGYNLSWGEDKAYGAGPLWVLAPLSYNKGSNSTGGEIMEIRSAMLRTATDFIIKSLAGMHY